MGYFDDVRQHTAVLIRGATFLLGGLALILLGTLIGAASGKLAAISAGTIATIGIVVMFLGFFMYILPPLLPAK